MCYWPFTTYTGLSKYQERAVANLSTQSVTDVHHWNDSLFSFKTTRDRSLKFENGHFLMLGIEVDEELQKSYVKQDGQNRYDDLFMDFSCKYIYIYICL